MTTALLAARTLSPPQPQAVEPLRFAAGLRVVVLLPWRDGGCRWRRASRAYVHAWWDALGIPVVEGDCGDGLFNRSAAINRAAVEAGDWDVAIIGDNDTVATPEGVQRTVEAAAEHHRIVLGFTSRQTLSKPSTVNILRRRATPPLRGQGRITTTHVSGLVGLSRQVWETIGGMDERFQGWSAEDRALHASCVALCGPDIRIEGRQWHLWHPRSKEANRTLPQWQPNHLLAHRYKQAAGLSDSAEVLCEPDREEMLRIMQEPGGPLDTAKERMQAGPLARR